MGTEHDLNGGAMGKVTEQACRSCHTREQDPQFDFRKMLPLIAHANLSGESLKSGQSKPAGIWMKLKAGR